MNHGDHESRLINHLGKTAETIAVMIVGTTAEMIVEMIVEMIAVMTAEMIVEMIEDLSLQTNPNNNSNRHQSITRKRWIIGVQLKRNVLIRNWLKNRLSSM